MTQVIFLNKFMPGTLDPAVSLLIYDLKLGDNPIGQKIIETFPVRYGVRAGESLKNLHDFANHAQKMSKVIGARHHQDFKIIALGGGSVGDFAGFFSSVFKRGTNLILIPSTWLAAMDSSHGGKNGLNLSGAKNQIGTFHCPQKVLIVKNLLLSQPDRLAQEALGELFKMALLSGGPWTRIFLNEGGKINLWSHLPKAIRAKYRVVAKDPLERSGHRQILNLGHTFGHLIEADLKIPHGQAVGEGLILALRWSLQKNYLSQKDFNFLSALPLYQNFAEGLQASLKRLSLIRARNLLVKDKKKALVNEVYFIFLKGIGKPIRRKVTVDEAIKFLAEEKRFSGTGRR